MPFLARCVFCGQQMRVPDHALGASMCCPKCSNFFTLAPENEASRRAPPAGPTQTAEPRPSVTTCPLPKVGLVVPAAAPQPELRGIDPLGLGALFLGGAALLCASVSSLCSLVLPLSGVGLLVGLAALLGTKSPSRPLLPAAAAAVGGLVLLTAWFFPNLLGPRYLASRGRATVDTTTIRVLPAPGGSPIAGPLNPDWVDASQAVLQQGPLQVQVLSASIRSVKAKPSASKTSPPAEYLSIRLRMQRAEAASEFAANRSQMASPRFEQLRPTLTDKNGKVYQVRDVQEVTAADNKRKSALFPVSVQDEVFVFEAPTGGAEDLRLEVPVEALGGKGAFRFTIPGSMIEDKRFSPTGSAAGR